MQVVTLHPGRAPEKQGHRLRSSIKDMQGERPFFRVPILGRDRFTRATVAAEAVLVKVGTGWLCRAGTYPKLDWRKYPKFHDPTLVKVPKLPPKYPK
jgi:hypothetical protein